MVFVKAIFYLLDEDHICIHMRVRYICVFAKVCAHTCTTIGGEVMRGGENSSLKFPLSPANRHKGGNVDP